MIPVNFPTVYCTYAGVYVCVYRGIYARGRVSEIISVAWWSSGKAEVEEFLPVSGRALKDCRNSWTVRLSCTHWDSTPRGCHAIPFCVCRSVRPASLLQSLQTRIGGWCNRPFPSLKRNWTYSSTPVISANDNHLSFRIYTQVYKLRL